MNELSSQPLQIRPFELMCLVCRAADGSLEAPDQVRLQEIRAAVQADPGRPAMLRANVDQTYSYQNPGHDEDTPGGELFNEKRDLDILQRLGLVPGSVRPARELLQRICERIPATTGICGYGAGASEAWPGCPRAASGCYEQGRAAGLGGLIPLRAVTEMERVKARSAAAVMESDRLLIRPHHLLCLCCFQAGRGELLPLAEDNLQEVIIRVRREPELPITLIRGCCDICPPCPSYSPDHNWCISPTGMALRDQKKDLDVLQRLGLTYGATLPAREMFALVFERIDSTTSICGYGDRQVTGFEWTVCGKADTSEAYHRARDSRLGFDRGD